MNDFAKALHDKQKITLAFLTHVELHLHFGRKACFVQGLFGAGKTFTTAMLAFITGAVLGQRMLWVSHNNKPLEEAAKILAAWVHSPTLDAIGDSLRHLFKRVCAFSVPTKYDKIDVSAKTLDSLDGDCIRVLLATCWQIDFVKLDVKRSGAQVVSLSANPRWGHCQLAAWDMLQWVPPLTLLVVKVHWGTKIQHSTP